MPVNINIICSELDRLDYSLTSAMARVRGVRKRIIDEWILGEQDKVYGNPPVVLSRPLAVEQLKEVLISQTKHIQHCAKWSKEIEDLL